MDDQRADRERGGSMSKARSTNRGLKAVAIGSVLFALAAAPALIKRPLYDTRDQLLYLAIWVLFAIALFWLFSRPRK